MQTSIALFSKWGYNYSTFVMISQPAKDVERNMYIASVSSETVRPSSVRQFTLNIYHMTSLLFSG